MFDTAITFSLGGMLAFVCLLLMLVALLVWLGLRMRELGRERDELKVRCDALRQSEARFHAIADFTYGIEAWLNPRGKLVWINRSIERLTGYTPLECLVGPNLSELLISPADRVPLRRRLARALLKREDGSTEIRIWRKNGELLWVQLSWQAIHGKDGTYLGLRVSADDIQNRKDAESVLVQQATRDPLTGLYNRRRFAEELDRLLADAERRKVRFGLLLIDLDGFKPINDQFGHQAGDEVLVTLSRQVGATIRRSEALFRLGGDEFAVLAGDSAEIEMVGLAQRIGTLIGGLKFEFGGREVRVSASLGIALFPDHGVDAEQLIAAADAAMYEAKHHGKNGWHMADDQDISIRATSLG